MRILAILTVRNEAPFVLEWLAHHRAAGFTDFLVFSNDCDDGTDAMLDRLQEMGQLTHLRNDARAGRGVQWAALKAAEAHPLTRAADWIMVLDIDEFVNVHVGDRTLPELIAAVPGATAFALTWRVFGNGGVVGFADRPVLHQFTRAVRNPPLWPWRLVLIKTLFRNDGTYRGLGVHRPRGPDPARLDAARWVDGSGRDLPRAYRTGRLFGDYRVDSWRLAQVNHYPLGSMEGFMVKRDRGKPNRSAQDIGLAYWVERNLCHAEDRSILGLWPETRTHLDALRADPQLARLHAAGVAWRRARFAELMRAPAHRELFECLLLTPPTRPIRPEEARMLIGWARDGMARHGAPDRGHGGAGADRPGAGKC